MTEAQRTRLKSLSLRDLKKEAWTLFSEYKRQSAADWKGMASCVSCGALKHWREGQAGHWPSIAGRNNSILFSEEGVHFQCCRCNIFLFGNPAGYDKFMKRKYGQKKMDELLKLKAKRKVFEPDELIEMIEKWVNDLKKLDNQ